MIHHHATADLLATVSIRQALTSRWQVIIVGAGPAGAAAAIRLARAGIRVLLIDKTCLPRTKLCGCCLSSRALRELADLGMTDVTTQLGAVPLREVALFAAGHCTMLPLSVGASLSRDTLDAQLVRMAIDAGAAWLPGALVRAIQEGDGGVQIRLVVNKQDNEDPSQAGIPGVLVADCAIIATGLATAIRSSPSGSARQTSRKSRLGLGAVLPHDALQLERGKIVMAVAPFGYCGLVRLEDGRVDVAAAVDPTAVATWKPPGVIQRILATAGTTVPSGIETAYYRGTPPLTHAAPIAKGRMFRVGDAARYVEPFTGEGIAWALCSARILSEVILGARGSDGRLEVKGAVAPYIQHYKKQLAADFIRCSLIAKALQSPRFVSIATRVMAAAPRISRRLAPWVTGTRSVSVDGERGMP
jgi:flavin-dependent dehydrogenase